MESALPGDKGTSRGGRLAATIGTDPPQAAPVLGQQRVGTLRLCSLSIPQDNTDSGSISTLASEPIVNLCDRGNPPWVP